MNFENIDSEILWISLTIYVLCFFTSQSSIEFIFTKWASQGSLPIRFSESRPWADRVRLYSLLHLGRACEGCGRLCLFKLCHSTAESRKSLKTILVTRNTSVAGDPWGFWRAGNWERYSCDMILTDFVAQPFPSSSVQGKDQKRGAVPCCAMGLWPGL